LHYLDSRNGAYGTTSTKCTLVDPLQIRHPAGPFDRRPSVAHPLNARVNPTNWLPLTPLPRPGGQNAGARAAWLDSFLSKCVRATTHGIRFYYNVPPVCKRGIGVSQLTPQTNRQTGTLPIQVGPLGCGRLSETMCRI
jgi:hypothetical protein